MTQIKFEIIDNQEKWDSILTALPPYSFMQSFGYSRFAIHLTYSTFLISHSINDVYDSYALAYKITAKRGTFLCISHGPVFKDDTFDPKLFSEWDAYLTTLALKEKCSFIRIAPPWTETTVPPGYLPSPIHVHAETTSIISLQKTEQELLASMRKTMRQMIKKSFTLLSTGTLSYEWVEIIDDSIYEVYSQTTKRGHFIGFSKSYLQSEYDYFKKYEDAKMLVIKHGNTVLSWGLFIYIGNKAFYHHGANVIHKDFPSAYLFYWLGILKAKEVGCISYDLWGIAPKNNSKHPWSSITVFKSGFGGEYLQLAHAIDKPLNMSYYITWIIERLRAVKRGFWNYQ